MISTQTSRLHHATLALTVYTLLLLCQLLPTNAGAASATNYSIVMASAPGKSLKWEAKKSSLFNGRTVYVERTTIKGSPWERLCLGFFETRDQAASLLKDIQRIYPGAWIQKTSERSITSTLKQPVPVRASAAKSSPVIATSSSTLTDKQLESLMQRAQQDIRTKQYSSAIRYLTALIEAGDDKYSRDALELLGQARQRNGQYAHAVNTYEKYLTLYPEGKDSDRVRQRLVGLQTASKGPRDEIPMSTEDKTNLTSYGTLSQYYYSNIAETDDIGKVTNLSQLITFADATAIYSSADFDQKFLFAGDLTNDFIDSNDSSEMRFIQTYYELSYRKTGTSGRIGRQQIQLGGILKRFDGLSAGYQFTPEMRLNFLGGFPVDIEDYSSINDNKTFYGFTFETGTFLEHWDMNLFYFEQEVDGLTDQNSVGTELRYFDSRTSVIGLVDYDVFYNELNVVQLNSNFLFDFGTTVFLNYFRRNQPPLSTSNALIGRPESTIEELKETLDVDEIYQLAIDRTAINQTLTIGGSQPVSERLKATADISFTRLGDTPSSGGVLGTEGTDTDYIVTAQLVGNSLMVNRDSNIFGLRYYGTAQSDTTALFVNSRFPISRRWWINPRLQYDIRKYNTTGTSQNRLRAALKTNYLYLDKARFDFEVGYYETFENISGQSNAISNIFFVLGYRWDF